MTFTKQNLMTIRRDLAAALDDVGVKHGIRFDLGGIRFNANDFRATLNAKTVDISTGVAINTNLMNAIKRYNLVETKNGKTLVDYNERRFKYPFTYTDNGKRYKGTTEYVKLLFAAPAKVPA